MRHNNFASKPMNMEDTYLNPARASPSSDAQEHIFVGCLREEKDKFWTDLDEVVESIPKEERLVIGADFNGHVGEGNRGDEMVMGRYGDKARNAEGQMLVDFATRMEMAVVNTYFKKREEHRVTHKSG